MIAELESIADSRNEGGRTVTTLELDFTKMSFNAESEPCNDNWEDEEHFLAIIGPDSSDRTDLHQMRLQILTVDKYKPAQKRTV